MIVLPILSFFFIAFLLLAMFARVRPWSKVKIEGRILQSIPLGLWQRIRLHSSGLLALITALVFGTLAGWLPNQFAILIGLFTAALLFMPVQYTLTTRGVAVGEASFRPWNEFSGVSQGSGCVVLQHPAFLGRLRLYVQPEEIEPVLRKVLSQMDRS